MHKIHFQKHVQVDFLFIDRFEVTDFINTFLNVWLSVCGPWFCYGFPFCPFLYDMD